MKQVNEKFVNEVLSFIKETQKDEGRSPSFRQICKYMSFPSIATAQFYIKVLKNRGLITQNDTGRIDIPQNLQKGQTLVVPLVGNVACGQPILAEENIEETYQLPVSIFGKQKSMILRVKGDSMIDVGINDGDLIVATITNSASDGEIVVALIDDSATIKRFYKKKDCVILHPENAKYKDIIVKDVKIQGVVKHVIHNFSYLGGEIN